MTKYLSWEDLWSLGYFTEINSLLLDQFGLSLELAREATTGKLVLAGIQDRRDEMKTRRFEVDHTSMGAPD